jgi:hypothetical protein
MGINASGQIVGIYDDSLTTFRGFLLTITPNPSPPAGTTADMILRRGDGTYEETDMLLRNVNTVGLEIYDIVTTRSPMPRSWARSV